MQANLFWHCWAEVYTVCSTQSRVAGNRLRPHMRFPAFLLVKCGNHPLVTSPIPSWRALATFDFFRLSAQHMRSRVVCQSSMFVAGTCVPTSYCLFVVGACVPKLCCLHVHSQVVCKSSGSVAVTHMPGSCGLQIMWQLT